jgi:hypothetical protein
MDTEPRTKANVSYLFGYPKELKRDTKSIGIRSEAAVMNALVRHGFWVSIPYGENSRYDLVADDGERLYRIQVKTGQDHGSYLRYSCSSSYAHRGRSLRSYQGEVEYVAIYCAPRDKVYLIPEAELTATQGHLRYSQPENGQKKRIRWAGQYELL